MGSYENVKVNVSEGQKEKIKQAFETGSAVSIRLTHGDLTGEHVLALTLAQCKKMAKAYNNGKGMTIKMSKTQLEHNRKIKGGFLQFLIPLLASLATGAVTSIGSKLVDKISGSGVIYVKKNGMGCKIIPAGQGLFLTPWNKANSVSASGLYMKTASGLYMKTGSGLLLGPNSPFQNIPILGMIL